MLNRVEKTVNGITNKYIAICYTENSMFVDALKTEHGKCVTLVEFKYFIQEFEFSIWVVFQGFGKG